MPPKKQAPIIPLTDEQRYLDLGTSGLDHRSGYVQEEFLKELQGTRGIKNLREMGENDSTAGAVLFGLENLVRQVPWAITPHPEAQNSQELADFFQGALFEDMTNGWSDTLSEITTMFLYGWAFMETTYKKRSGPDGDSPSKFSDGKIGWRKMALRGQSSLLRWQFDENGGIQGMYQQGPPDYRPRYVPIEKALLFRTTVRKNNPEGRSLLRSAWPDWYRKKHIQIYESIGIERSLAGFPKIKLDKDAPDIWNPNDPQASILKARLEEIGKSIRMDEQAALIEPWWMELTLMNAGAQRTLDMSGVIGRYDTAIARSVLMQFIMLGSGSTGSFALSSDQTELFAVALGAYLDSICEVINRHAIPRLMKLNGWPADTAPTLTHGDIEKDNLGKLGEFIQRLSQAGMPLFPDPALEAHIREEAGLPPVGEGAVPVAANTGMAGGVPPPFGKRYARHEVIPSPDHERTEFVTAMKTLRQAVERMAAESV